MVFTLEVAQKYASVFASIGRSQQLCKYYHNCHKVSTVLKNIYMPLQEYSACLCYVSKCAVFNVVLVLCTVFIHTIVVIKFNTVYQKIFDLYVIF